MSEALSEARRAESKGCRMRTTHIECFLTSNA
jgi:hypothetical protein